MIKVISLGGSIIAPDNIDVKFLKKFRKLILAYIKKGNKVIIVTGGGKTCRNYQNAARKVTKISDYDLDWVGTIATRLNGELVRAIFSKYAYKQVLPNLKKVKTNKPIIVGAGVEPGHSSDYDTAVLAKLYKATEIINLSNVYYVYDKDPRKYKNAKKLPRLSWKQFFNLFVKGFKPGMHIPFDQKASKLAQKHKIKVVVTKGTDLGNLKKILYDKKFKGTLIG